MSYNKNYIEIIKNEVRKRFSHNNNDGHNFEHFETVMNHAIEAIKYESLDENTATNIILAALLHDLDDAKLFPNNKNNENTRDILNMSPYIFSLHDEDVEQIIEMINLVSTSKNGDSEVEPRWKLIPRDCDRLEAIGKIGIIRCFEFALSKGNPMFNKNTPKCYSEEDLDRVATEERFKNYDGKSKTMIDHFYDKLLHIGKIDKLKSNNKYCHTIASERNQIMRDFVINFFKNQL